MPDRAQRLPERPSLEQLRKQAKDRLALMRATTPDARLSDAQLALARDYGFASWPKLVSHVRLHGLEQLAVDLVAGYQGDVAALRRIGAHFGDNYSPEQIRVRVIDRVDGARGHATGAPTLDDTRFVVARLYQFGSWHDMAESGGPPFCRVNSEHDTIDVRPPVTTGDWDTIAGLMREHGLTGINAACISDAGLERIARVPGLRRVNVEGARGLSDDGLLQLASAPQLEELNVGGWHNPVTDRGLEVLRHLPNLRRFAACWPQRISDAGAANLVHCELLEHVNLLGTPTGDGVINALRGRAHLAELTCGKQVTDAGVPLLRDVPLFRSWRRETQLTLDGPMTDRGLWQLEGLDGLFDFQIFWHSPLITGDGLRALASLPRLEKVGCDGRICDDTAMRHLAAMSRLKDVMIQGAVAGDDGFTALARSRTIESIWGRECPNLGGRGFVALAAMPRLRSLKVSCKFVDDASLAALPSFPALRSFMPMDVSDAGFRHVGRCGDLEDLSCMYCRDTGDEATSHLTGLRRLTSYYAGKTRITDRSLEILAGLPALEKVDLWECAGVTNAGVAALARLPQLREVSVSGSPRVSRQGMAVFSSGVKIGYD